MKLTLKKYARQGTLSAAHILLLLLVPVICLAFGGKVSYPNGNPAAGAQVSLIINDTSREASFQTGNAVLSSQGNPITKSTTKCDSAGRFNFPDHAFTNAMIQIKAPDGKDFATVTLPAKIFASGDVAIVLLRKQ